MAKTYVVASGSQTRALGSCFGDESLGLFLVFVGVLFSLVFWGVVLLVPKRLLFVLGIVANDCSPFSLFGRRIDFVYLANLYRVLN